MQKEITKKYLTTRELARMLDVAPGTLHNHRTSGTGPAFIKVFGAVRYAVEDVEKWLDSQRFQNAAQAREARRTA